VGLTQLRALAHDCAFARSHALVSERALRIGLSQLLHMFYAAFLMLFGAKGKSIESLAKAPDFRDFHDRIRAGGVNLADDERKLEYAKVHMNQVLRNRRTGRFQEALRIVSMGM
jgi:hypothetical protein